MLQPTRTKYRKAYKGRIHGYASRGGHRSARTGRVPPPAAGRTPARDRPARGSGVVPERGWPPRSPVVPPQSVPQR